LPSILLFILGNVDVEPDAATDTKEVLNKINGNITKAGTIVVNFSCSIDALPL